MRGKGSHGGPRRLGEALWACVRAQNCQVGQRLGRVFMEIMSVLWYHTCGVHFSDGSSARKKQYCGTTLPWRGVFIRKISVLWYHTSVRGQSFSGKIGPVVPHFRGGEYSSKKSQSSGTTLPRREYSSKKNRSSGTTRFWEYFYFIRALPGQPKISTGEPHCLGIIPFRCRLGARATLDQGVKRRTYLR